MKVIISLKKNSNNNETFKDMQINQKKDQRKATIIIQINSQKNIIVNHFKIRIKNY